MGLKLFFIQPSRHYGNQIENRKSKGLVRTVVIILEEKRTLAQCNETSPIGDEVSTHTFELQHQKRFCFSFLLLLNGVEFPIKNFELGKDSRNAHESTM